MKKNSLIIPVFAALLLITACKKTDHYKDSGAQSGVFQENIYQFLEQRPFLFDSLVQVINLSGMKQIIESEEITFFAPPDAAILRIMNDVNADRYYQGKDSVKMNRIPADVWRKFLARYIFKGKYLLNDIARIDFARRGLYPGQNIESYDGYIMNMGVVYSSYNGTQDVGARTLHLTRIGDLTNTSNDFEKVATSNLQPKNGVVHALKGIVRFSFSSSDFVQLVNDNVP